MSLEVVMVAIGGATGAVLRYSVCELLNTAKFPFGTFSANIIGCLCIGAVFTLSESTDLLSPQVRLLIITGFLGGFTTFSSFTLESIELLQKGEYVLWCLYLIGSVVTGVSMCAFGMFLGKKIITML